MLTVDLNCDMGEGCGHDAELMQYISSANIACGFHAGDVETMNKTVELALEHGVAIGAHPGYSDRENFGRGAVDLPLDEVTDIVIEQLELLRSICARHGTDLHHMKPHGAMYNQAAKDPALAAAIAEAVKRVNPKIILYGLSGSCLVSEAERIGLRTASEVFADRTYQRDGSLTPRSRENALIEDSNEAVNQVVRMIQSKSVAALTGETVPLRADTICIHGDGPMAVVFARTIHQAIRSKNIAISSI